MYTHLYTKIIHLGKECRHIHAFSNAVVSYNKYDIISKNYKNPFKIRSYKYEK